eukprot:454436-Alexandrium_andersonii.AAC.1
MEFCRRAISMCFASNVFQIPTSKTEDERFQISVMQLRAELFGWYRGRRKSHPNAPLTELQDLTTGMLGSINDPTCKTKGAETKGLLIFMVEFLHKHEGDVTNAKRLAAA